MGGVMAVVGTPFHPAHEAGLLLERSDRRPQRPLHNRELGLAQALPRPIVSGAALSQALWSREPGAEAQAEAVGVGDREVANAVVAVGDGGDDGRAQRL